MFKAGLLKFDSRCWQ